MARVPPKRCPLGLHVVAFKWPPVNKRSSSLTPLPLPCSNRRKALICVTLHRQMLHVPHDAHGCRCWTCHTMI